MTAPPDPNGNGAPSPDGAPSQKSSEQLAGPLNKTNTETLSQLQARSLCQRYALGYYFAATVAQLAWGALPR